MLVSDTGHLGIDRERVISHSICLPMIPPIYIWQRFRRALRLKINFEHCKKLFDAAPHRLQRMLLQLQNYDIGSPHVSGKQIPVSDCLSRQSLPDTYPGLINCLYLYISHSETTIKCTRQTFGYY